MRKPHPRSPRGVAERNGVCLNTVYNEIKRGHLEASRIGSRRVITEAQETAWLERNKRSA